MRYLNRASTAVLGLLAALPLAHADVTFTSPPAGYVGRPGEAIHISFGESGAAPTLSDLQSYTLFLCAGGDTDSEQVQLRKVSSTGTFSTLEVDFSDFPAGLGGATTNAYFFKMISVAAAGGTVTNFSPRFTLQGMTGVFPANVITALKSVSGTSPPPTVNNVGQPAPAAPAPTAALGNGPFAVPYSLQTGPTRYAPPLAAPGTKITAKKTAPLYPPSSYVVARKPLPPATVVTTYTSYFPVTATSIANTAAPATIDNGLRFLHRGKY